ncbi:MAG: class E sortase [Actinobacteria bacterium]|nr:class E sortase [Actinomycetota bacterium]
MRANRLIVGVLSIALLAIGVVLIAYLIMELGSGNTATNSSDPGVFNVPEVETTQETQTGGPEDKTLRVSIPRMARVADAAVPDADGDDEEALGQNAAIHLKGTGFPWQEEANVYLAGHRLGYPSTPSFLAFYDLDAMQVGDEVYVEDANGKEYTYRVFDNFVVGPTDLWVTETVPGKNILTLQTCTLPDYSQRLIVQAELVNEA